MRSPGRPRLRPELRVERLGREVIVLDPAAGVVHRLTGPAAEAVLGLREEGGVSHSGAGRDGDPVLDALAVAGVIEHPVTRRRAVGAAAALAAGVVTMGLPRAAAASTGGRTGPLGAHDASTDGTTVLTAGWQDPDFVYRTFTRSGFFVVDGTGALDVDVLVVGGGGGGGRFCGGGGGGGAVGVFSAALSARSYRVDVGAGGGSATSGQGSGLETVGTAGGGEAGSSGPPSGRGGATPVPSSGGTGNAAGEYGWGEYGLGGGGAGAGGDGLDASAGGHGGGAFTVRDFFLLATTTVSGGGGAGGSPFIEGGSGGGGDGGAGGSGGAEEGSDASGIGSGGGGGAGDATLDTAGDGGRGADGIVIVRYAAG